MNHHTKVKIEIESNNDIVSACQTAHEMVILLNRASMGGSQWGVYIDGYLVGAHGSVADLVNSYWASKNAKMFKLSELK